MNGNETILSCYRHRRVLWAAHCGLAGGRRNQSKRGLPLPQRRTGAERPSRLGRGCAAFPCEGGHRGGEGRVPGDRQPVCRYLGRGLCAAARRGRSPSRLCLPRQPHGGGHSQGSRNSAVCGAVRQNRLPVPALQQHLPALCRSAGGAAGGRDGFSDDPGVSPLEALRCEVQGVHQRHYHRHGKRRNGQI